VGRVEMLRSLGMTYKSMEAEGIMMPVLEMKTKYIKPALYDEEITVRVMVDKMPGVRMHFKYELFNEENELINVGETTLAFIDMKRNRPCLPSTTFLEKVGPFFN